MTVPGQEGEMTILGHHEPLISTLKEGNIRVHIQKDTEPKIFHVAGGILEVRAVGATVIL
jgi:F0F1-type ATP synthase epsilon subunit